MTFPDQDPIKAAFSKVKQDISSLQSEFSLIKSQLQEILDLTRTLDRQTIRQSNTTESPTQQTDNTSSTHSSTDNLPLEASKPPISPFSTGNEGVSTDRQTDRQTDNSTGNEGVSLQKFAQTHNKNNPNITRSLQEKRTKSQEISEFLESLDDLKKDLRNQIKKLTNQEMAVFATIYQLEEQGFSVDYSLISQKLNISESSIRDYTLRIIRKGIPLDKFRENNKKIYLSIPKSLRSIAPLQTLLKLREI